MSSRYRSKIDAWFIAVIVTSVIAHLWVIATLVLSADWMTLTIFIPIAVIGLGLPLWILFRTHYTLSPNSLNVRCGPFSYVIPIKSIKDLRPTRSVLSAPALSLDRLEITYGKYESVTISPLHRERFLAELEMLRQATL
jgi:hypothetical protein